MQFLRFTLILSKLSLQGFRNNSSERSGLLNVDKDAELVVSKQRLKTVLFIQKATLRVQPRVSTSKRDTRIQMQQLLGSKLCTSASKCDARVLTQQSLVNECVFQRQNAILTFILSLCQNASPAFHFRNTKLAFSQRLCLNATSTFHF